MLLYTQIENGQALYPASGIGFFIDREIITAGATEEDLAQANIVQVTPFTGQAPVDGRQYRVEIIQQSDDSWAHELVEVEISEEQYANNVAVQTQAVKADRDRMIAATDWIVTKSAEAGEPVPESWKTYRQALRDIPEQAGFPFQVTWPTRP
jgi:hypothetical protein